LSGFLGGALKVCFSLRSWPLNIIYYNSTENPRIWIEVTLCSPPS
jgi:hypothetical protein